MLALLLACTAPDVPADTRTDGTDVTDVPDDSGGGTDTSTTPTPTGCEGRTVRPWDPSGSTGAFDTVAPDFTVALADGSAWTLSEHWSGCDSVVGIAWLPDAAYPDLSKKAKVKSWLEASPPNVQYLIWVDAAARDSLVAEEAELIAGAIDNLDDPEAAAWWAARVHVVADDPYDDSWMGQLNQTYRTKYPTNWAIDRFQTVRELGYFGDPLTGWSVYPATFINYEVVRFNQESDRDDRLAAEDATVVRAFDAAPQSSGWVSTVDLPDAAGFDSLEIDLTMACGHPEPIACPEWDYLVYAYLCDVDDAGTADVDESSTTCTQFGRFITAYARSGRWTVDASPFLALVGSGGPKVVRFASSNAYDLTLDLRFYDRGTGWRPYAMQFLWTGGGFNENYDSLHPPIVFTPPADAGRVDVVGLITGHGYGQDRANCAEFCNHQHEFTVNEGGPWLKEEPDAGSSYGCAEQTAEQTLPNQYGTWVYGRGGWCPGKQVDPWSADVTAAVDLGGANTIQYRGLYQGETYYPEYYNSGSGFGATIDGATWLVYYRAAR